MVSTTCTPVFAQAKVDLLERARSLAKAGKQAEAANAYFDAWNARQSDAALGFEAVAAVVTVGDFKRAEEILKGLATAPDPVVAAKAREGLERLRAAAASKEQKGPSLAETLGWLRDTLQARSRKNINQKEGNESFQSAYHLEPVEFVSCRISFREEYVNQTYGPNTKRNNTFPVDYEESERVTLEVTFILTDIEPSSIKATDHTDAPARMGPHFVDWGQYIPPAGDVVVLSSEKPSISMTYRRDQANRFTTGETRNKMDQKDFRGKTYYIFLDTREMAERVAKAFAHAATLCRSSAMKEPF